MNALDLPAAPPPKGPLTLSDMAGMLVVTFGGTTDDEADLAYRINLAIDNLLAKRLVREWGYDEKGRTTYEPSDPLPILTRTNFTNTMSAQPGHVFYLIIEEEQ